MKISITLNRLLQATKERKKKIQQFLLHVELPSMSPENEPEQKK